jgi:glutathione S-transferase
VTRPILVIGNRNYSSWSFRGWLVLAHSGIEFDVVRIPLFTEGYQQAIADVMFAPVVSRFHTYGIKLDRAAADYNDTVVADAHVRRWYEEALRETEIIKIYD